MLQSRRQHHRILLAITAGWTLAILALYFRSERLARWHVPYLQVELAAQDWVAQWARPAKTSPDLFFLAIDAPSHTLDQLWDDEIEASPVLKLMKQKVWSREIYAQVLERLAQAGAKVVAFDLMFPGEESGDPAFAAALDKYRATVIVGAFVEETDQAQAINPPARTLIRPSRDDDRIGFVNFWPDADNVIRRARLRLTRTDLANLPSQDDSEAFESLAARMARKAGHGDHIPAGRDAHLFRYAYKGETLRAAQKPPSLYQIFVPTFWEKNYGGGAFFKDKIVLVGPEGNYNKDLGKSPFGIVAGPEFHLNAANAILQGEFLRQTPLGLDLVCIALGGLLAWTLGRFLRPAQRLFLVGCGAVAWFGAGVLLYNAGWVVPVLSPALALTGSGFLFSIAEQVLDRREKTKLRKTFERYVSRDVVKELVDNPAGWLNTLEGQRKKITVLFSDLRGFTALTESANPHQLVAQLNEYFNDMVGIVFAHQGTLDKFIGDAVMAHWGSIKSDGEKADACRAVATAVEMRRSLARLNADWTKRGMIPLKIGIGVNHGDAIVGNLGCEAKMEVSVIGDSVNVASRLEGATKSYHIDFCIGESVAPLVREAFVLRSLDLIVVKGKSRPLAIFTVLGPRNGSECEPVWLGRHEEAVQRYRVADFAAAAEAWREVLAQTPGDAIAEVFLERCIALAKSPPPADWQGVFEMTSK